MTGVELLVLGAATWRISSLIVNERGPLDVFIKVREAIGITHDEDGIPTVYPDGFFGGLLSCVWCFSVWVGIGWTLFYLLDPSVACWLALPFCLSGMAIVMEGCINR